MQTIKEELENLKKKVKEVYYIRKYDQARKFEEVLKQIEEEAYDADYSNVGSVVQKIVDLNWEIDGYMKEEGNLKKSELMQRNFARKIKEFIENSQGKKTEQLLLELKNMILEARKLEVDEKLNTKLDELSASALVQIFLEQIKNQEPIDLSAVKEVTTPEIFAEEIQKRMIQMTETKEEAVAFDILECCKTVSPENLENKKVWEILSGSNQIRLATEKAPAIEPEVQEEPVKSEELSLISAAKPSIFSHLMESLRGNRTTKYTLNENGKIKVKYATFPPNNRLLKKCEQSCIGLEINDVECADINCINKMSQLETLVFGNNVTEITELEVEIVEKRTRAPLKTVIFSDSVEKLETRMSIDFMADCGLFSGYKELTNVTFGNNITDIGEKCFFGCSGLKTVKLPDSLQYLGDCAFGECENLESVEFGENLIRIGHKCFYHDINLAIKTLPDSVRVIGAMAFENIKQSTSVTSLTPNKVSDNPEKQTDKGNLLSENNKKTEGPDTDDYNR